MSTLNPEAAVRERYAAGAHAPEAKLCCPVDYNAEYLKVIPQEVIDRDYGCGDTGTAGGAAAGTGSHRRSRAPFPRCPAGTVRRPDTS